jgi:hypothetical protein
MIAKEISNFRWKIRSSVVLQVNRTPFIQRLIFKNVGNFLLQESWVHPSCKKTSEDENDQSADNADLLTAHWYWNVAESYWTQWHEKSELCVMDTLMVELASVTPITKQPATTIQPAAEVQPVSKGQVWDSLAIHAVCMQSSPCYCVGNIKTYRGSSRTVSGLLSTIWMSWLTSPSAVTRTSVSVPSYYSVGKLQ